MARIAAITALADEGMNQLSPSERRLLEELQDDNRYTAAAKQANEINRNKILRTRPTSGSIVF